MSRIDWQLVYSLKILDYKQRDFFKWIKDLYTQFIKLDIQVANKYMWTCLASISVWKAGQLTATVVDGTKEKNDRMPQNVKILTARNNGLLSTPEPTQCTENLSLNTVLSPPLCTVKLCVCTQTKRHTHAMNKHHKPHTHTHTPVTSFQKTKKIFGNIAWDSFICNIWDKTVSVSLVLWIFKYLYSIYPGCVSHLETTLRETIQLQQDTENPTVAQHWDNWGGSSPCTKS